MSKLDHWNQQVSKWMPLDIYLKDLWTRSIAVRKEIMSVGYCTSRDNVEMIGIIEETIGSECDVKGGIYPAESIVAHTHLDSHPPSAPDFMHCLQSSRAYGTGDHMVVGSKLIWRYSASANLQRKATRLFGDIRYNNGPEALLALAKFVSALSDRLVRANQDYTGLNNIEKYIHELEDIGFNVSVIGCCVPAYTPETFELDVISS